MTIANAVLSSSKKPPSGPPTVSNGGPQPQAGKGTRGPAAKTARGTGNAACCAFLSGVVVMGFVMAAFVVYWNHGEFVYTLYSGYHDGDQVLASQVANSYSSRLCRTYKVSVWADHERGASFYLTDGPAVLSPESREVVVIRNSGLRSEEEFDYRAFYLLPGSVIETSACMSIFNQSPSVHAEVLFIKGTSHFSQWTRDSRCADCVAQRVLVTPDQLCEAMMGVLARYVIDHADTYYVVITRQRRSEDDAAFGADVTMKVIKTVYDVSRAKQTCQQATTCTFNLTYNADDDVVVEFPFQNFSPADPENSFTADCGIRIEFFLVIFILIPAGLIFLVTLFSCLCCLRTDGQTKVTELQKKKAEVRAALTRQNTPQENLPPV